MIYCLITIIGNSFFLQAQNASLPPQPKLIVGIVVDQMSYEFLYRYNEVYSDGGFNKLVKEGFSCENTHYNYVPTYTGPGHASIYTGSVPAIHGIVSNNWFERKTGKMIYCVDDTTVKAAGIESQAGAMSPRSLVSTTITDMLQLSNQQQSKVIGIALKDRGAILPAGHTGDAAYWYDGAANAWITSTYYMDNIPAWVNDFNSQNPAAKYLTQSWELMLPSNKYKNATSDSVNWEALGSTTSMFPHHLNYNGNSEAIKSTPFGNSLTMDFAKAAVTNENLGKDAITDFLCMSFSSTDYVGHVYGPHSVEIEDTYLHLDKDLASFLIFLDAQLGKGNYLIFLTADHGVAPVPAYMQSLKIPAGVVNDMEMLTGMKNYLNEKLGEYEWIASYTNQQIYLSYPALEKENISKEKIYELLDAYLTTIDAVANILIIGGNSNSSVPENIKQMVNNGIYPKRSGDIQILYDPYYFEGRITGTTHGSHYAYDTHVPLVWYGGNISAGKTYRRINITDIAPTIAVMLKISEPNGSIGIVIEEVMK